MTAPDWKGELKRLQVVLSAWYSETVNAGQGPPADNASMYRDQFQQIGNGDPAAELKRYERIGDKSDWWTLNGYFPGAAVQTRGRAGDSDITYWPLASFSLRAPAATNELELSIRLVLFAQDETGAVDAWGWRLDSPDSDGDGSRPDFHPYPHVQHISRWEKDSYGFQPPGYIAPAEETALPVERHKPMPETRPAIPLASKTPAGLVVAGLIAVYGPRPSATIVATVGTVHPEFQLLTGRLPSEFES